MRKSEALTSAGLRRRKRGAQCGEPHWPPPVKLATRIIELAIHDFLRPCRLAEEVAGELGFASVREEVEAFLTSDWCRELLKYLDCDLDILALLRERTLTTESTARPKS